VIELAGASGLGEESGSCNPPDTPFPGIIFMCSASLDSYASNPRASRSDERCKPAGRGRIARSGRRWPSSLRGSLRAGVFNREAADEMRLGLRRSAYRAQYARTSLYARTGGNLCQVARAKDERKAKRGHLPEPRMV
jgi:hypothetical protein